MKTEEYLKVLEEQIRCKKAKNVVGEEIRCHIEDQKMEFLREGMKEEDAEEAAVREMGDPIEAGMALDRVHRPKMAWGMIVLIGGLSLVGYLLQYLMHVNWEDGTFFSGTMSKQLFYSILGFAVMIGVCFVDYSRIGYWAKEITLLLFACLFVGIKLFGMKIGGANAWIVLFGIQINVRLIVFLFVPLYGAVLYSYRGLGYQAIIKGILWMIPAFVITASCAETLVSIVLFLSFMMILLITVAKDWFAISRKKTLLVLGIGTILLPVLGCFWMLHYGSPYHQMRMLLMINPASEPTGEIQVLRQLFAKGQWLGSSQSQQQIIQMVPNMDNYMVTYVMAYYGILAAVVLVGVLPYLFLYFFGMSLRQKNQLGMIMGVGCASVFFVQMVFYVLGNMGILFGGMYCPFLTYGGSGSVVTYLLFGMILSIYRYQDVLPEVPKVRVGRKDGKMMATAGK